MPNLNLYPNSNLKSQYVSTRTKCPYSKRVFIKNVPTGVTSPRTHTHTSTQRALPNIDSTRAFYRR